MNEQQFNFKFKRSGNFFNIRETDRNSTLRRRSAAEHSEDVNELNIRESAENSTFDVQEGDVEDLSMSFRRPTKIRHSGDAPAIIALPIAWTPDPSR